MNLLGVLLAFVRASEPYVLTNIIADLYDVYNFLLCRKNKTLIKRAKFSKESLDSFLNSAMNIEYVYLILLGINTYLGKSEEEAFAKILYIDAARKTTKITFDKVEIRSVHKWDVKSGSFSKQTSN